MANGQATIWKRWSLTLGTLAAAVTLFAALRPLYLEAIGAEPAESHAADMAQLRAERIAADSALHARHAEDMRDIRRMLACALFDVPDGCTEALKAEILTQEPNR